MQRCENCPNEFEPTKPVRSEQRFCSPKCRKAAHYRQQKDAKYAAKVEAAEARINGQQQMNGHGEGKIGLVALGAVTPSKPIHRKFT